MRGDRPGISLQLFYLEHPEVGPYRENLGAGTPGTLWSWALQGHSGESRPGEEKSLAKSLTTPHRGWGKRGQICGHDGLAKAKERTIAESTKLQWLAWCWQHLFWVTVLCDTNSSMPHALIPDSHQRSWDLTGRILR